MLKTFTHITQVVKFMELPDEINNPKYKEINIIPLEVSVRENIGVIVSVDELTSSLVRKLSYTKVDSSEYIFNIGKSDSHGVQYILDLNKDLCSKKEVN